MQKIFKIWLIFILILSIIALFLVETESFLFGFVLLPLALSSALVLILGFFSR